MARINSLHIENFRVIGELDYKPRQINIIIGQNNTGKSALLDAVFVNATGELISPSTRSSDEIYNIKNQKQLSLISSNINSVYIYRNLEECRKADPASYVRVLKFLTEEISEIVEGDEEYKDQYLGILFDTVDFMITISDFSLILTPTSQNELRELRMKISELNRISGQDNDKNQNMRMLRPIRRRLWTLDKSAGVKYNNTIFKENTKGVNRLSHSDKFQLERLNDKEIHLLEKFIINNNLVKNIERLTQNNVLYSRDGEIEEIPISAHGDGFIALLTTLHNLLQSEDGILIIEEPENHLHPRYLGVLIETLFTYCKRLNVQVFMATHSYDLIQGALEYPETETEKGMLLISKMTSDGETIEKFDYTTDEGLKVINELYLDLRGT